MLGLSIKCLKKQNSHNKKAGKNKAATEVLTITADL